MSKNSPLKLFTFKRILIPILIGLGVAIFMVYQDINEPIITETALGQGTHYWVDSNNDEIVQINELLEVEGNNKGNYKIEKQTNIIKSIIKNWTWASTLCLFIALLFTAMRDLMYMYRIRLLSDKQLSWRQSFEIIMLWEFGSAITPSIVGGSALAFFIVSLEGIPPGRSTAIVMITALLDELFYIVIAPITILIIGSNLAFVNDFDFNLFGNTYGVFSVFLMGYGVMCFLTLVILLAIFISPKGFKYILLKLSRKRLFKKISKGMEKMGNDVVMSSKEFRGKSFWFWTKAYLSTVISWSSRFLAVNFLILAFTPIGNHLLIFVRQLVMWIILLISPTPGSSGVAEFAFPIFLGEFLPVGTSTTLSVLWRTYTYYPYIVLGLIVLPIWTSRIIKRKRERRLD